MWSAKLPLALCLTIIMSDEERRMINERGHHHHPLLVVSGMGHGVYTIPIISPRALICGLHTFTPRLYADTGPPSYHITLIFFGFFTTRCGDRSEAAEDLTLSLATSYTHMHAHLMYYPRPSYINRRSSKGGRQDKQQ